MKAIKEIFEYYVDDATASWAIRENLLAETKIDRAEVAKLEQWLTLSFNGLMTDLNAAWEAVEQALGRYVHGGGEVFTATVIAVHTNDITKIRTAITAGLENKDNFNGAVAALAWLPEHIVHPWITQFLRSKDLNHKTLALSACSVRHYDPAELLSNIVTRHDCLAHQPLYVSALKLIGEVRRYDLTSVLNDAMLSDNETIRYWATHSTALLQQHATRKPSQPNTNPISEGTNTTVL